MSSADDLRGRGVQQSPEGIRSFNGPRVEGSLDSSVNSAPSSKPRVQQPRPQVPGPGGRTAAGVPLRPSLPTAGYNASASGSNQGLTSGTSASVSTSTGPRIIGVTGSSSHILVNKCQKGNPLLQHFVHKGWEYADIVPDYQVGERSCVLYLSIKYHRLHPEYIHHRVEKLQRMFDLRVLLIQCDVDNHQAAIQEITKVALVNKLTVMVAWRIEEAARYIELYKMFEHKAPDVIRERVADDYISQLTAVLTSVRGVNKTDVLTLATNFGSLENIAKATKDQLLQLPGFGETKARRLFEAFTLPFRPGERRSYAERHQAEDLISETEGPNRHPLAAANGGESLVGSVPANVHTGTAQLILDLDGADDANGVSTASESQIRAGQNDSAKAGSDADDLDEGTDDEFGLSEAEQLRLAIEMSMAEDALAAAEAREADKEAKDGDIHKVVSGRHGNT